MTVAPLRLVKLGCSTYPCQVPRKLIYRTLKMLCQEKHLCLSRRTRLLHGTLSAGSNPEVALRACCAAALTYNTRRSRAGCYRPDTRANRVRTLRARFVQALHDWNVGRSPEVKPGSAEFRFAETLRFVLRESRRLQRTRSLRYFAGSGG